MLLVIANMSDVEREDENVQDVHEEQDIHEVERRERKTTEKGEDYRQERIAKHEKLSTRITHSGKSKQRLSEVS